MDVLVMIIIMFIAGFFSSMNIWVEKINDVRIFHINDIYMIILMTAWMIFLMSVYNFTGINTHRTHAQDSNNSNEFIVMFTSLFFIIGSYWMIRNQTLVNDAEFIRGMIPHHSMAILMSEKIKNKTSNQEIKMLADKIISSQRAEINQMKEMEKTIGQ